MQVVCLRGQAFILTDISNDELAKLEQTLHASARQVFEIIPSYFNDEEALAVAAVIAQVCVAMGSYWQDSPQVRKMLERYAALDTRSPFLRE
jgi:hypothetical protein